MAKFVYLTIQEYPPIRLIWKDGNNAIIDSLLATPDLRISHKKMK